MPITNDPVTLAPVERVRLPGYGGYAFSMRPTWLRAADGALRPALDLEILTPAYRLEVLGRPVSQAFVERIGDWLFATASREDPEAHMSCLYDPEGRFSIACEDSNDLDVYLHIAFHMDDDRWAYETLIEGLWCARVTVLQAATDTDSIIRSRFGPPL